MLKCPHCFTNVPRGASVCTGCGAELHYGIPTGLQGAAGVAAIVAGLYVGNGMNGGMYLGALAGFAVLGGLVALLKKRFKDHVEFKRQYRTKQ